MTVLEARSPAAVVTLIRCTAGAETYAIEMARVRSLHRADRLRRGSGPDGSVGLLAEREGEIPVYSLAQRLGRPARGGGATQQVVLLHGVPRPQALLVDHVSQAFPVPSTALLAVPTLVAEAVAPYFHAIVRHGEQLMLCLSPERLIPGGSGPGPSLPYGSARPGAPGPAPATWPGPQGPRRRPATGQLVLFATEEPAPQERPIRFGLGMAQVLAVLAPPPILPVPRAPEAMLGLVAWQGEPVPVLDLGRRLGLAPYIPSKRTRILIVRASDRSEPVGLLARSTIRVVRLPLPHMYCTQPPPVDSSLVRGVLELRDETLVIPDLAKIAAFASEPGSQGY